MHEMSVADLLKSKGYLYKHAMNLPWEVLMMKLRDSFQLQTQQVLVYDVRITRMALTCLLSL